MKLLLLACAGGALGAGARHLVNVELTRSWGVGFPWATLTVNIAGSLLIGGLAALLLERLPDTVELRAFLMTGILGGFTTFSAFSLDFVALMERAAAGGALTYAASSVLLSIAACWAGLAAMRALLP
ncbi:MAG: fluoride efflux transporter CrcB [Hyphomicrobiaceae bacterium]|nr:fluoride efflux transporter CrcB [Hyphomicrobiaceae bacterium]